MNFEAFQLIDFIELQLGHHQVNLSPQVSWPSFPIHSHIATSTLFTSNCNKMTVWNIIIILTAASAESVVMAQEKMCSSFCTSLGMLELSPGKSCNEIYQINKMTRGMSRMHKLSKCSSLDYASWLEL